MASETIPSFDISLGIVLVLETLNLLKCRVHKEEYPQKIGTSSSYALLA